MNLKEYITKEFGIVPDEVQINKIEELAIERLNTRIAVIFKKVHKKKKRLRFLNKST